MSDGLFFCKVPQFLGRSGQCRWRKRDLTYSVTHSLPGIEDLAWLNAIKTAFSYWSEVCNLKPVYTDNAQEADILITVGREDGPSGVLAWSEMPCGGTDPDQLRQEYDIDERWVIAENPTGNSIDVVRVLAHEIGHALGIPHFNQGAPALLAPQYSSRIRRPQPMDIEAAVARYGPPVPVTPIPPTIPPTTPPPIPPTTPPPIPPDVPPNVPPVPGEPPMDNTALMALITSILTSIVKATPNRFDDFALPVILAVIKGLLNRTLTPAQVEQMLSAQGITIEPVVDA